MILKTGVKKLRDPFILLENDGGHGMLFKSIEGDLYICLHSPNQGEEEVIIVPVSEEHGYLKCDF